ncbi:response regulator transcription factor [Marinobacter caseinilyticus]|uniref:response regulator transcription factor n=1 Tax=Marinobacter caseinilyticus TaxID=2692195 RepID=UPI00140A8CFA|nr:response regulator transcription factor [Marinobacter caseinilyticus]
METLTADGADTHGAPTTSHLPLARVLIVDDHPFFAHGLGGILMQENLALSVGNAASVPEALEYVRDYGDTTLVLLDLTLPGEAGLSLLRALEKVGVPLPVVVISSREDETAVRAAKAAGAVGFMPKSSGRRTLIRMIQCVSAGSLFYPSLTLTPEGPDPLTPRQLDVLRLLADGFPNKRICQSLDLTEHTVKTHLKAIFTQLGVHNRTECVARAQSLGLL